MGPRSQQEFQVPRKYRHVINAEISMKLKVSFLLVHLQLTRIFVLALVPLNLRR
jgi:hypothetical protein